MRKREASSHKPVDRIVLPAERGPAQRAPTPARRAVRPATEAQRALAKRDGQATMDYQMGFTSGTSI